MPGRPNPDGWKGGSEDFDTQWQSHGHRVESTGLFFDRDDDPDCESGLTKDHSYPNSL